MFASKTSYMFLSHIFEVAMLMGMTSVSHDSHMLLICQRSWNYTGVQTELCLGFRHRVNIVLSYRNTNMEGHTSNDSLVKPTLVKI